MTRDNTTIGERGRARRLALGMSTVALAARLGCSRERVHTLECYGASTIGTVERWALALDMDPRELAWGPFEGAKSIEALLAAARLDERNRVTDEIMAELRSQVSAMVGRR